MPDPREQQPKPEDLTEKEKHADPSQNHEDEFVDDPERQSGG
jgi:hypothetical protein